MEIEYSWNFSNIKIKTVENQDGVVHSYRAILTGTFENFTASKSVDIVPSSEKEIENFYPYSQLTKNTFIEWTENSLGLIIDNSKRQLEKEIIQQIEDSKLAERNAPWEVTQ